MSDGDFKTKGYHSKSEMRRVEMREKYCNNCERVLQHLEEAKAEIARLKEELNTANDLNKDRLDDWKRIQDGERKLAMAMNGLREYGRRNLAGEMARDLIKRIESGE